MRAAYGRPLDLPKRAAEEGFYHVDISPSGRSVASHGRCWPSTNCHLNAKVK
jgi:hypothetical protein